MMVIFLVGLVSMILMRTLRKDYARYSKEDDIDDMVSLVQAVTYLHQEFRHLSSFLYFPKILTNPFYHLLVCLKDCWMSGK